METFPHVGIDVPFLEVGRSSSKSVLFCVIGAPKANAQRPSGLGMVICDEQHRPSNLFGLSDHPDVAEHLGSRRRCPQNRVVNSTEPNVFIGVFGRDGQC